MGIKLDETLFNKKGIDQLEKEANEGRNERIARYRTLANLEEDFEITDDNLDKWAFNRVCVETNCDPHRLLAELKNECWSDYENR